MGEEKMQAYLAPPQILAAEKKRPNVLTFCAVVSLFFVIPNYPNN
jgi:hypothetical protein